MNIIDIIVNEHVGKSDRDLLHKLLAGQHFITENQTKIMSALDDLKAAIANEDTQIAALVTAYNALVAKLNTVPTDDTAALEAIVADANAQAAAINAALNPVAAAPATPVTGQ